MARAHSSAERALSNIKSEEPAPMRLELISVSKKVIGEREREAGKRRHVTLVGI